MGTSGTGSSGSGTRAAGSSDSAPPAAGLPLADCELQEDHASAEGHRDSRLKIVIVGGGFGGLEAAKCLKGVDADVLLLDSQNHHCFQPLLYQVASAELSPADVAWPIRGIVGHQRNTTVLMTTVTGVNLATRTVLAGKAGYHYDFLIVATGASHSYFGNDVWAPVAPGLKRIEDAVEIRRRILLGFEQAECCPDLAERRRHMTFAVVGGGPTGVELAGAIAEIARHGLSRQFRNIRPDEARVLLIEAGPRILPSLPEDVARYAADKLERMGVEVAVNSKVSHIDDKGLVTGGNRVETSTALWAAGVRASPAAEWLSAAADRSGRVLVEADLSLPEHPEVFVIGDTAAVLQIDGTQVPGLAPAAKQMGAHVAGTISAKLRGRSTGAFRYRHRGDLATIGRGTAVIRLPHLHLKGFMGWLFWSLAHIYLLIGARNRIAVAFSWLWDYVSFHRGARLITVPWNPLQSEGRQAPDTPPPAYQALEISSIVHGERRL